MILSQQPLHQNQAKSQPDQPRRVITGHLSRQSRLRQRRRGGRRPVRREVSAGGVVVRKERDKWLVALLKTEHKRGEVWVLPKGHVEPEEGETVAEAAKREVQEEAGITSLAVKDQLGVTRYSFQAEEALVKKTVHYFLMITAQKRLTPQAEENLIDAIWLPIDEAIGRLAYDTDRGITAKAREKLTGSGSNSRTGSSRPGGRRSRGLFSGTGAAMRIHT